MLAGTVPRHTIPRTNPSLSAAGDVSSRTNWSYGLFVSKAE
jgi:hypothetical protein